MLDGHGNIFRHPDMVHQPSAGLLSKEDEEKEKAKKTKLQKVIYLKRETELKTAYKAPFDPVQRLTIPRYFSISSVSTGNMALPGHLWSIL